MPACSAVIINKDFHDLSMHCINQKHCRIVEHYIVDDNQTIVFAELTKILF